MVQHVCIEQPHLGTRRLYHVLRAELTRARCWQRSIVCYSQSYHITTNSHHRFRKHKNLIEHKTVIRPEQVWVSDITYVGNRQNPMYLSLVTDAYSKKIVGCHLDNTQ